MKVVFRLGWKYKSEKKSLPFDFGIAFHLKNDVLRTSVLGREYVTMSVGLCLHCMAYLRRYADPIDGSSRSS